MKVERKKKDAFLAHESGIKIKIETDLQDGEEVIALVPSELVDVYHISEKDELNYDNIIEATILNSKCIGEFNEIDLLMNGISIKAKDLIGKDIPLEKDTKVLIATDKDDYRIFQKNKE